MKILKMLADYAVLLFLALAVVVFSVLMYIRYLWQETDFEKMLVTLNDLSLKVLVSNASLKDFIYSFAAFAALYPLCYFYLNTRGRLYTAVLFSLMSLYFSGYAEYFIYSRTTSNLYEEEYVFPDTIEYDFPEKKRNLILIYLESFEQNFASGQHYGKNLIPHLNGFSESGQYSQNFSSIPGTDYSIAALVASHCGIPLRYQADRDIYALKYFLPKAVCFSDILHQNGYQSAIIKAADITFTNANIFAVSHGYDEALGVDEVLKQYPEDQHKMLKGTFGGINDEALFSFAKKKLAEFAPDKPFLLTLFSLDTHTPTPHRNPSCPAIFNDIRDVYMCTDKTVYDFVNWLKETPYWENTTVVILGDHLKPSRMEIKGHVRRGIYNAFINLPDGLKINKSKPFTTFDIAPTLLESLGIHLSQPALGLGRSLFGEGDTLAGKKGFQFIKNQIRKNSNIYREFHKPATTRENTYADYAFGETLRGADFTKYTDAYEEILGSYYIDRANLQLPPTKAEKLNADIIFYAILRKNNTIIFTANNQEIFKFSPQKRQQPYHVNFDIPAELAKDGKLQLIFRNTGGVDTSTQMGIAPAGLTIREK